MKKLKNNILATKIQSDTYTQVVRLCKNRGIRPSDFFRQAIINALNSPYLGSSGSKKMKFQRANQQDSFKMIGSRFPHEVKLKVEALCRLFKISRSQFYRFALHVALVQGNQPIVVSPDAIEQKKITVYGETPLILLIKKQQKERVKMFEKAEFIGNIIGLGLCFLSRIRS